MRLRSFADAGRGIATLVAREPNARLHLAASVAVLGLGVWLGLAPGEWCWVVAAIAWVWLAESLNTAFEELADVVHPGRDARIGRAKDLAAGGVLVAALAAAAIGAIVLGPRLLARWSG